MKTRIGGVPYGVGAPLLAGMAEDPAVELLRLPPTQLVEPLRRGEIEAGLLSSIEAIRHPGYRVVAGIGIASKREVRSVRAFRRPDRPIRTVGVDSSSATSVALLRMLLAGPRRALVAGEPEFTVIPPTHRPGDAPFDLVMMIGDAGLEAETDGLECWDLASEWRRWTGLPFVFAVWVLPGTADARKVVPLLRRARERGRAMGAVDGTHGAVHYDLDDEDMRGLRTFWQRARTAGFGRADAEPDLVTDTLEGATDDG